MRLRTLNGVPLAKDLNFSSDALTNASEIIAFDAKHADLANTLGEPARLRWRMLPTAGSKLRMGCSQPLLPVHREDKDTSFSAQHISGIVTSETVEVTENDACFQEEATEESDFVEQSYVFHNTLLSSQIAGDLPDDATVSSASFMSANSDLKPSFGSTTLHVGADADGAIAQFPSDLRLTTLLSVPSAKHIRAAYPQTLTSNMLCVITTAPTQRSVVLRRRSYVMNLTELTVADDTRSGFMISFWSKPRMLRSKIDFDVSVVAMNLQVGDIVLLRNVALNAFRDTVHGQSLSTSITRVKTTIHNLQQNESARGALLRAMPASTQGRFLAVRQWARAHVASAAVAIKKRRSRANISSEEHRKRLKSDDFQNEVLPPDTCEEQA